MQSENTWLKTLCNAFELPEAQWLPEAVSDMLAYLLANPACLPSGDILYLRVEEQAIFAQLLTILTSRGEIIAEKPLIIPIAASSLVEDPSAFWPQQLFAYAAEYDLYNGETWNLKQILLKTSAKHSGSVRQTIAEALFPLSVLMALDQQPPFKIPTSNHPRPVFNAVLIIDSQQFFIEKKSTLSVPNPLEIIPFASENLLLDITRRYKIFSFAAGSAYNLADDKGRLHCKVFVQDHSKGAAAPDLCLEYDAPLKQTGPLIELYLNLARNCLEIEISSPGTGERDDVLTLWQQQHQAGHDLISRFAFIDPQLSADYGRHLKTSPPLSGPNISKSVYYRAVTLLNIFCNKK